MKKYLTILSLFLATSASLFGANSLSGGLSQGEKSSLQSQIFFNIKELGGDVTGKNDSSKIIQKALNEIRKNNGGTIYLPKGTYLLNSQIRVYKNTKIVGDGHSTIVKAGDEVYGVINMSGANDSSISEITLDGNVADRDKRAILKRCVSGIFADLCSRCEFKNIKFIDLGYKPLTYSDISLSCGGNHLTLAVDDNEERVAPVSWNIVEGCEFIDNEGRSSFGIRLWSSWELKDEDRKSFLEHNIIRNNLFVGFNWNSIELAGPSVRHNVVDNNICKNHYGWGCIEADKGASYNLFTNNIVKNIANPSNGTIYGYRDASDGEKNIPIGNKWVNNRVENIQQIGSYSCGGMLVENSVDCQIDGLYVENVESSSVKKTNAAGIFVDKSKNCTIKNCIFNDCFTGLYIIHSHNLKFTSNKIEDCRIAVKFMAGNIDYIYIKDNIMKNNLQGILLAAPSRDIFIEGNRIKNSKNAIFAPNPATTHTSNNTIE